MLSVFYHLSFNGDLNGLWNPRTPAGFDKVKDAKGHGDNLTEPKTPRICLSASIEGCFYAIYPNIYSLFEVNNYPHGLFYLYRGYIDITDPKYVPTTKLTMDHLVWDAHVTREVWYTGDLEMAKIQQVRITPSKKKLIYTKPFNDETRQEQFVSPEIKIDVVKRFADFYTR